MKTVQEKTYLNIKPLCLLIMLGIMLALSACGNSAPNEARLKNDLLGSNVFKEQEISDITTFAIEKRITSREDRLDVVYVNAESVKEDGAVQFEGAYIMTYGLYNEGWILDNIEVTSQRAIPLKEPEYTDEDLMLIINTRGYCNISNLSVLGHEMKYDTAVDLYSATYSVTFDEIHRYVTFHNDVSILLYFNSYGWDVADAWVNSSEEEWDICGTYENSFGDQKDGAIHTVRIEYFNPFDAVIVGTTPQVDAFQATDTTVRWWTPYWDDDTKSRTTEEAWTSGLIDVSKSPLKYFYENHGYWNEEVKYEGFTVECEDINWNDIMYYSIKNNYLIGRDHIYRDFFSKVVSEVGKIYIQAAEYELIPVD